MSFNCGNRKVGEMEPAHNNRGLYMDSCLAEEALALASHPFTHLLDTYRFNI